MDFPIFLTALKEIAIVRYGIVDGDHSEKMYAMLRLAEEFVIPAARPDDCDDEYKLLQDSQVLFSLYIAFHCLHVGCMTFSLTLGS